MRKLLLLFTLAAAAYPAVNIFYPGGTVANTTITDDGTKQTLASGIEDCLNTAGWTTNAGHHALPTTLTSGTGADSNVGKVVMSAATNTVQFKIQNVSGSVAPAQAFGFLLPGATTTWGCTAHQFGFVVRSVAGGNLNPARSFVVVFVPYTHGDAAPLTSMASAVPSMLGLGNGLNDTDTGTTNRIWRGTTAANVTHTLTNGGATWTAFAWGLSDSANNGSNAWNPAFSLFFSSNANAGAPNGDVWSDASGTINYSDVILNYSHNSAGAPHIAFDQGWAYGSTTSGAFGGCTVEGTQTIDSHTFVVLSGSVGDPTYSNRIGWCWLWLTCASGTSCSGT